MPNQACAAASWFTPAASAAATIWATMVRLPGTPVPASSAMKDVAIALRDHSGFATSYQPVGCWSTSRRVLEYAPASSTSVPAVAEVAKSPPGPPLRPRDRDRPAAERRPSADKAMA